MDKTIAEIRKIAGVTLLEREPMSAHTTFKIGGPIRAFVYPNSFENLQALSKLLAKRGVEPLYIGNGSNILASDEPIDRIAICTRPDGSGYAPYIDVDGGGAIKASSGILLSHLAVVAAQNGLSGLEWATGIPGTLGGAIKMNAGAYGGEMKDVVFSATAYEAGNAVEYMMDEAEDDARSFEFSYRHSAFSERSDIVIADATLMMYGGEKFEIESKMRKCSKQRKEKQPLDLPSAGSAFKRPEGGYAAELIDKAGLKGYTVGGAQISEKHAGFIVNVGGATCSDVLRVMEHAQSEVLRQFGVELEPEIMLVR